MTDRPTFYFNDDERKPIRAGGIVFYQKRDDDIYILLMKCRDRLVYEDFGGKTDSVDKDYHETVLRELLEESNNKFDYEEIKEKIHKQKPLYNKHGKYVLFLVELIDDIDPSIFGDYEIHDNIYRDVAWVSLSEIEDASYKNICVRLRFKTFRNKLVDIKDKKDFLFE